MTTTTLPAGTTTAPGPATTLAGGGANNPALHANVSIKVCQETPDGYTASGLARAGAQGYTYHITIDFVALPGRNVEATAHTTVVVAPGSNGPWHVSATFQPMGTVDCVVHSVS